MVHGPADGRADPFHHDQPGVGRQRVVGPARHRVRADQRDGLGDLRHRGQPLRVPGHRGQQRDHRLQLSAGVLGPAGLGQHERPGDLEPGSGDRDRLQLVQHGQQGQRCRASSARRHHHLGLHEHDGVAAGRPLADGGGLGQRGPALVGPARGQGAHPPPQRDVPQVQRMAQRLGRGPVGQRIRLPVRDGARLQQGDEPQPPPEQPEDGIAQAIREVDDLGGVSTPRGAVVRAGDGVAQCGQGGREGRVVTGRTGLANRLGSQLEPPGLREEQRRGDRQPGGDQRDQRALPVGQHGPGLLEQADLLAVEQPDFESGGPAAEAERGAGEQVGPPGPAGALGRLAEPGPAAVQVPGCEPGGSQPQRGAGLLVVAGPQGREAGRGALVPVHRVLEGQGGQRPVPGAAGVLGGWPCRRGPGPRQVVGDLGVIDVPAPPGQRGQDTAGPGVQVLADVRRDGVVDGVADQVVPEPVLAGLGELEQACVTPGRERAGQLTGLEPGQPGQDVAAEARAQDRGGQDDVPCRPGQLADPGAGQRPHRVGHDRAGRRGFGVPADQLPGELGHQERVSRAALGDDPNQVRACRGSGHAGHHGGDVAFGERLQRDDVTRAQQRGSHVQPPVPVPVAVPRGDQHGGGHRAQGGSQLGQQPQRGHVGLVRVVDDHQTGRFAAATAKTSARSKDSCERAPSGSRPSPAPGRVGQGGQERRVRDQPGHRRVTARQDPHHPRPRAQRGTSGGSRAPRPDDLESIGLRGGLLGQPGLADAGFAGDRQQRSPPGARGGQHRAGLGQHPGARHQRDQHSHTTPCRSRQSRRSARFRGNLTEQADSEHDERRA